MRKIKMTLIVGITAFVALAAGGAVAEEKMAEKPAVEKIDGAFPPQFSNAGNLFEEAPMVRFDEVATFQINRGEKLREAMSRWTETAGYELVWQPKATDGDIIFAADMEFTDAFEDAAASFFEVVRTQTKFDGKLHSNNVLRVFVANAKR